MDGMMHDLGIVFALSTLREVFSLACLLIIFDVFFSYPCRKWRKINWICVFFYISISLIHGFATSYGSRQFAMIVMIIYLVRIIPLLWVRYGFNPKFLVMVLFYENIINCLAQNVEYIFLVKIPITDYFGIKGDLSVVITEMMVFGFLMILSLFKRANLIKIYFTELTIAEYIILFLNSFFAGILQNAVLREKMVLNPMRMLSFISFALLMILIMHVIMVRDQNTSMNDMIGNLKKPMKQIADSYIEMNEKNTELRRFRHDTKNLLLALRLLISEGKFEQAVDYIDKMQDTIEMSRVKLFDTGNFIADALLESKAKIASQNDIIMTVEGNIPSNRVEDVNLVILISNLVDNAIEAAKQVKGNRKIQIQSILKKNIWILSVKNSCLKDIVIRENRIETTKKNKEAHGFGLSNIERVIHKYAGELQISCENQVFTARATLQLNT